MNITFRITLPSYIAFVITWPLEINEFICIPKREKIIIFVICVFKFAVDVNRDFRLTST